MRPLGRIFVSCLFVSIAFTAPAIATSEDAPVLRVGVKEAPPFVEQGPGESWSGLSIMLWEAIAIDNGYAFEYVPYDLVGLLDATATGQVDIAIGALSVTPEREAAIDFTHAYYISGLGIAVHRDRLKGWFAALRRFASTALLKIVASLMVLLLASGLLVWLFERRKNPEMFGGRHASGIGAGFWWAAVTMTTVGYGDKTPNTTGGRTVALIWMFASLIVVSGFTASIASALTIGQLNSPIEGPDDLADHRVVTVTGSSSVGWLKIARIKFRTAPDLEAALESLRQGTADALVYDKPILHHVISNDPGGSLMVLPRSFRLEPYAFALPPGSGLREAINRALLDRVERPEWHDSVAQHTGTDW